MDIDIAGTIARLTDACKALGISLPGAIAGLMGGFLRLMLPPALTGRAAWSALVAGGVTGGYFWLTEPLTLTIFGATVSIPPMAVGVGIGFLAMWALAGIAVVAQRFSTHPTNGFRKENDK